MWALEQISAELSEIKEKQRLFLFLITIISQKIRFGLCSRHDVFFIKLKTFVHKKAWNIKTCVQTEEQVLKLQRIHLWQIWAHLNLTPVCTILPSPPEGAVDWSLCSVLVLHQRFKYIITINDWISICFTSWVIVGGCLQLVTVVWPQCCQSVSGHNLISSGIILPFTVYHMNVWVFLWSRFPTWSSNMFLLLPVLDLRGSARGRGGGRTGALQPVGVN